MKACLSLKDVLLAQGEVLQAMVELEEETQQVLVRGDARALKAINARKKEFMEKMNFLEEKRSELLPGNLTLKEYISRENPSEAEELEKLRTHLLHLHSFLQRLQKINKHLLHHNLKFIEYALRVLFPHNDGSIYARGGEIKQGGSFFPTLLDSNA